MSSKRAQKALLTFPYILEYTKYYMIDHLLRHHLLLLGSRSHIVQIVCKSSGLLSYDRAEQVVPVPEINTTLKKSSYKALVEIPLLYFKYFKYQLKYLCSISSISSTT